MDTYLAIDIGASSGRHMLGYLENGKLICEEIHRFPNGMVEKDGQLCWDLDTLFAEVLAGLKKCRQLGLGKTPVSVGIDTWGVDFVLLDADNHVLGNTVGYRDARTEGMDSNVYRAMAEDTLYSRTGIQKQSFNTIYQLMALKQEPQQYLKKAKKLLLLPDYFHHRLCGVAKTEYTNATTTNLVNAHSKDWDDEILAACGYPKEIFMEIVPPGTVLGELTPDIQQQVGFCCKVVLPATHDTGSAVVAVPAQGDNTLYISSGTWSLVGVERLMPDCSPVYPNKSFTNEGGYAYRYRYLKNIMGLWMIQQVKRELDTACSYAELCALAEKETIASIVDCNESRFLAPKSMTHAIQQACLERKQEIPRSAGELAAVVYNSLAACYAKTVAELEQITGQRYPAIYIVGGGANAGYLNKLTAAATRKTVYAGPTEATAIGNILVQMIASGAVEGLGAARACVKNSFAIQPSTK